MRSRAAGRETDDEGPPGLRRALMGGSVGHFVEWFDYAIYGYMAATLADVFFPDQDDTAALLSTWAVFAVPFLVRPLGGFFFGHRGDQVGRQRVLALVILLMSVATFGIGLVPSYGSIGVWAPILLVALRLVQGFSAGGEYAGAVSFMAEYAPDKRRGFLASWVPVGSFSGLMAGSAAAFVLTTSLSESALTSWGWRLPFLLALPLGLAGLYLRLKLEDTPKFRALQAEETDSVSPAPLSEAVKDYRREILQVAGIALAGNGVGFYLALTYLPVYMSDELDFAKSEAFLSTTISLAVLVGLIPLFGALSDRVGRKPVLMGSCISLMVITYPGLLLMAEVGTLASALVCQLLLAVSIAANVAPLVSAFAELVPTRVRYSALSVGYNVSVALFGGTAPFFATWLISLSNDELAPGFYLIVAAAISFVAVASMRDRAGEPLPERDDMHKFRHAPAAQTSVGAAREPVV